MDIKPLLELKGELIATQFAIRGLILASPDPDPLADWIAAEVERWKTTALYSELDDATIAGIDKALGKLLPTDADIQRARAKPFRRPGRE